MMHAFLEEQGVKIGDVVHAVRVAVTGKGVGPGLYDCLELIGKSSCLTRIDRALAMI
jgi:glutamyl-tRNA synthetase